MTETQGTPAQNNKEAELEIYRQKYGVFRHLDSLRWQIPTFTLGAGALLLAFAAEPGKPPAQWSFFAFAALALFSSFAVFRVRKGIRKNHVALHIAAEKIGDYSIPEPARFGATWWLSAIMLLAAVGSITIAILK
jgi:hypothetical protein